MVKYTSGISFHRQKGKNTVSKDKEIYRDFRFSKAFQLSPEIGQYFRIQATAWFCEKKLPEHYAGDLAMYN